MARPSLAIGGGGVRAAGAGAETMAEAVEAGGGDGGGTAQ